jgi:hypothetical protein
LIAISTVCNGVANGLHNPVSISEVTRTWPACAWAWWATTADSKLLRHDKLSLPVGDIESGGGFSVDVDGDA